MSNSHINIFTLNAHVSDAKISLGLQIVRSYFLRCTELPKFDVFSVGSENSDIRSQPSAAASRHWIVRRLSLKVAGYTTGRALFC